MWWPIATLPRQREFNTAVQRELRDAPVPSFDDVAYEAQGLTRADYGLPPLTVNEFTPTEMVYTRLVAIINAQSDVPALDPAHHKRTSNVFLDYLSEYFEPIAVSFSDESLRDAFFQEEMTKTPGGVLAEHWQKKSDVPLVDFLDHCHQFQAGTLIPFASCKPKAELRPETETGYKAPRVFYPADVVFNAHLRCLFGQLQEMSVELPSLFLGKSDQYGDWHQFWTDRTAGPWRESDPAYFYDWEKQDITVAKVMAYMIEDLFTFCRFSSDRDRELAIRMCRMLVLPYVKLCFPNKDTGRHAPGLFLSLFPSGTYVTLFFVTLCGLWAHIYLSDITSAYQIVNVLKFRGMGDDAVRATPVVKDRLAHLCICMVEEGPLPLYKLKFCNRHLAWLTFRGVRRAIPLPDINKLYHSLQLLGERGPKYSSRMVYQRLVSFLPYLWMWKSLGKPELYDAVLSLAQRIRAANQTLVDAGDKGFPLVDDDKCRFLALGLN